MTMAANLEYPVEDPDSLRAGVNRHVEKWKDYEGNLIMILHAIQNEHGYIPRGVAMELARSMEVSLARIYEVITFYHYFLLVPPGKHSVTVCTGTACYLKGSMNLLEEAQKQLGIKPGETTGDRKFHLETVRCIGCCGMSPAMMVDGKTHGRLRTPDVSDIINSAGKEK